MAGASGSVTLRDQEGAGGKLRTRRNQVCSLWDTRGPSKWKDNHQTIRNAKWKSGCTYLLRNGLWVWSRRSELQDFKSKILKLEKYSAISRNEVLVFNFILVHLILKLFYESVNCSPQGYLGPGLHCATVSTFIWSGFHNRISYCTFGYWHSYINVSLQLLYELKSRASLDTTLNTAALVRFHLSKMCCFIRLKFSQSGFSASSRIIQPEY